MRQIEIISQNGDEHFYGLRGRWIVLIEGDPDRAGRWSFFRRNRPRHIGVRPQQPRSQGVVAREQRFADHAILRSIGKYGDDVRLFETRINPEVSS